MAALDQLHALDRLSRALEDASSTELRHRFRGTPCPAPLSQRLQRLRAARQTYTAPTYEVGDCGIELLTEETIKV